MECVPQPDFGQRHTQPAGDPWPDLRMQPRSFFKAPV